MNGVAPRPLDRSEPDQRALQIKGWSVTLSLAAIAAALVAKDIGPEQRDATFLVAGLASALFWLIEYIWKTFQWSFFHRIDEIEGYFRDSSVPVDPLQIRAAWKGKYKIELAKRWRNAFKPFIMLPHAVVVVAAVVLAIL